MQRVFVSRRLLDLLYKISHQSTAAARLLGWSVFIYSDEKPASDQPEIDFVDISADDPCQLSYIHVKDCAAPAFQFSYFENCHQRKRAKPAKVLRRLLGDNVTADELEQFAAAFADVQSPAPLDLSFEIVEGEAIQDAYNRQNYCADALCPELHNSCMADSNKRGYLEIYAINPDACKLGIIKDQKGKIHARCLLWYGVTIDGIHQDQPCRDRIYFASVDARALMQQSLSEYRNIYNTYGTIEISLDDNCRQFPYLDTFRFSDADGNFTNRESGAAYSYASTTGGRIELGRDRCENCSTSMSEDDICTTADGEILCSDCARYCEYLSEYYPADSVVYSECQDQYYLPRHARRLHNDDWAHVDDCTQVVGGDWYLITDTITTEDGETYPEDSEDIVTLSEFDADLVNQWQDTSLYYTQDSEDITETRCGRWILLDDAFTFAGEVWHIGQTIETIEGQRFPKAFDNLYSIDQDGTIHTV